jgi:hypothetical protein
MPLGAGRVPPSTSTLTRNSARVGNASAPKPCRLLRPEVASSTRLPSRTATDRCHREPMSVAAVVGRRRHRSREGGRRRAEAVLVRLSGENGPKLVSLLVVLVGSLTAFADITEDYLTGDPLVEWDTRLAIWLHAHSSDKPRLVLQSRDAGRQQPRPPRASRPGRAHLRAPREPERRGRARLYLGVHYLSDVLAGTSFGLSWASICLLTYTLYGDHTFPLLRSERLRRLLVR